MKLNPLGFLSLLALLGFMGLMEGHSAMYGFFGFACYLRYFFVTPDEMFMLNLRKAATIGFFCGVSFNGIAVAIHLLLPALLTNNQALVVCYVTGIFSFTITLLFLEVRETRG